MQRRLWGHHALARHFAVGIALAGLMLTFLAATLLVFPYKATANPEVQGELLYDLLGHLEYDGKGHFGAIDDPVMQQKLAALISGKPFGWGRWYRLHHQSCRWWDCVGGFRARHAGLMAVKWQIPTPCNSYRSGIINWRCKIFGSQALMMRRLEFRMVVALSAN